MKGLEISIIEAQNWCAAQLFELPFPADTCRLGGPAAEPAEKNREGDREDDGIGARQ